MNENSEILRKHIESLSDEELMAVVTVDRAHYREDAIAFAEEELEYRGLRVVTEASEPAGEAPVSFWDETADKSGEVDAEAEVAEGEDSAEEDSEEEDSEDAAAPDSKRAERVWDKGAFWQGDPQSPVTFTVFRSSFISWEELFQQAADFASEIGPERVISISHSEDGNEGVVAVWYRS